MIPIKYLQEVPQMDVQFSTKVSREQNTFQIIEDLSTAKNVVFLQFLYAVIL